MGYGTLIVVATVVIAASQLTSTLLLFDFGDEAVLGKPLSSSLNLGVNYGSLLGSQDWIVTDSIKSYWMSRPFTYPRYGEFLGVKPYLEDGLQETGESYRALRPFIRHWNVLHCKALAGRRRS